MVVPELTKTSPYVPSSVDSNTFTMGNPMPESTLTLFYSPAGSLSLASSITLPRFTLFDRTLFDKTFVPFTVEHL
jgi:hypothetical protein